MLQKARSCSSNTPFLSSPQPCFSRAQRCCACRRCLLTAAKPGAAANLHVHRCTCGRWLLCQCSKARSHSNNKHFVTVLYHTPWCCLSCRRCWRCQSSRSRISWSCAACTSPKEGCWGWSGRPCCSRWPPGRMRCPTPLITSPACLIWQPA